MQVSAALTEGGLGGPRILFSIFGLIFQIGNNCERTCLLVAELRLFTVTLLLLNFLMI